MATQNPSTVITQMFQLMGWPRKEPNLGHSCVTWVSYPTSLGLVVLICYKKMTISTSKGQGKTSIR